MATPAHIRQGVFLAILATIIWAGNFVIARAVINDIPPVALAFYRWLIATVFMLPLAYRAVKTDVSLIRKNFFYLVVTALAGITLFNTFVYVAAHSTTAINLALIGTNSSPVFSLILAAVFLKERITAKRVTGLLICIIGVIFLVSRGSFEKLLTLEFTYGDLWVIAAALFFAIYNILVRKKPAQLHPYSFLFVLFLIGTIMLLPAYLIELQNSPAVRWNANVVGSVVYLAIGTSVIAFIIWNKALGYLGAARTALFGNLIPVFSALEAVLFLGEQFTTTHLISCLFVFAGLVIANLAGQKRS